MNVARSNSTSFIEGAKLRSREVWCPSGSTARKAAIPHFMKLNIPIPRG
jgi:hypothetical protein